MFVGIAALNDLTDIYYKKFTDLYHEHKTDLLNAIGLEKAQRVDDVRKYLHKKAREIFKGNLDYFNENNNLVAILESSAKEPTKVLKVRKISKKTKTWLLAVQQQWLTYTFIYRNSSGGNQNE